MSKDSAEVYEGARETMNGLFRVYLHSDDRELRAKCREMMEVFWAWKDKQEESSN
jgi:hypothetical protein